MLVRRSGPLALAALLVGAACSRDVNQRSPAQTIVIAKFASPDIPTPNDLALQAVPTLPDGAQKNLLQGFVAQGGFPADQAPTLSVPIRAYTWDEGSDQYVPSDDLPAVDRATVTAETAALYRVDVSPAQRIDVVAVDPAPAGYVNLVPVGDASGRRLPAGRYVFAVRGGDLGVKTTDGLPISADAPIALTIPNKDLSRPENQPPGGIPAEQLPQLQAIQSVLWAPTGWVAFTAPGATGPAWTPCALIPAAAQPEACSPAPEAAYPTIDDAFPHEEVASIAAFQIAPPANATIAAVDAASGQAPLPFDLLRTGEGGHIALNRSFGPAAEGLTSLDGFSTTAMILAPVVAPGLPAAGVDAGTVHGGNVFLYELGAEPTDSPTLLPELKAVMGAGGNPATARYVAQPTPIIIPLGEQGCPAEDGCSPVIGLQPAVNTGTGLHLPPLKEKTRYAVVITSRVHDVFGDPLARPTLMTLLLDENPLYDPEHERSLVGGLDAPTAAMLQEMRARLAPVFDALPGGTDVDDVVLAYTFRTQTVTDEAMQIAALPYQPPGTAGTVLSAGFLTSQEAADQYGIDVTHLPAAPSGPIAGFAEVRLATVSLLLQSQNQGAFDPTHPAPEQLTALVALPNPALVTGACPSGFTAAHCAPLVVFRHGITRSKADLLPIAAALTARGFVVAAIDAEKHGDRSWCTSNAQCGSGSTCAFQTHFTGPTDAGTPIGVCESSAGVRGSYLNMRVDCAEPFQDDGVTPNPACVSPKGVPFISGNYLVSLNFFRTRDSLRQDVIDESALVKALAPLTQSTDALAQHLADNGDLAVDPTKIYWVSQSLGSSQGAVNTAANPRFSRMVFNAPGATLVDIFANPDSRFHAALLELIAPVEENTPDYLKLLQVAKWILDPAEPANFAGHVLGNRLASPLDELPGLPTTRDALAQFGLCDGTIPNLQNAYFASQLLGQPVPTPGAGGTGFVQWYVNAASGASCPDDAAGHGFLLDPTVNASLTEQAQLNAGAFLANPAGQPVTIRPD